MKNSILKVLLLILNPFFVLAQFNVTSGPNGCDNVNTSALICSLGELNGFTGSLGNTIPDSPPCPLNVDCGPNTACENNIWFSFVAADTSLNITIDPYNCNPGANPNAPYGMQGQVFQISDCSTASGFTGVSNCFSYGGTNPNPDSFTLNCVGLTPGGIYTVMLDGFAGSTCQFEIAVDNTNPPTQPFISNISGPTEVCSGSSVTYCIDYMPAFPLVTDYEFTFTAPVTLAAPFVPYFDNFPPSQVCVNATIVGTGSGTVAVTASSDNECFEPESTDLDVTSELITTTELPPDTICIGSGPVEIPFPPYYVYGPGNYLYTTPSYLGCDSTLSIEIFGCGPFINPLEVVHVCSSELPYEWFGQEYNESGLYTLDTINTDCGGCNETYQLNLFVYHNESMIANPENISCLPGGNEITLFGDLSVVETVNGYSIFSWSTPDGNIISDPSQANIQVNEPGVYTLEITTYSNIDPNFSCSSIADVEVFVDPQTIYPVSIDGPTEHCGETQVEYLPVLSSNELITPNYHWTVDGGSLTVDNGIASVEWINSGQVCLTAYNDCDTTEISCLEVDYFNLPIADFDFNYQANNTIAFENKSQFGDNYFWDFGDNNESTEEDPTHTFTESGTYQITLVTSNNCTSDTIIQELVIIFPPVADFEFTPGEGCGPLTVQFINTSTEQIDNQIWTFEGGNPSTSNETNPIVIFEQAGSFEVSLEVSNNAGSDQMTQTAIEVFPDPISAFSYTVSDLSVSFTNLSEYGENYIWDFGDWLFEGEAPTHVFSASGDYEVSLITTNDCGSDTSTQVISVLVSPLAGFQASVVEGCVPLTVQFENTSTGIVDNSLWTFEGGIPASSTESNPEIVFENAGIFDVSLEVSNASGSNELAELDLIEVKPNPIAAFEFFVTGPVAVFSNYSQHADTYLWDFGDNNTSTEENPSHNYEDYGSYIIALSASNQCGEVTFIDSVLFTNTYQVEIDKDVFVYPNPNKGIFTIDWSETKEAFSSIRIYNAIGQTIRNFTTDSVNQLKIDLNREAAGVYYVELKSEKGVVLKRVIKE